MPREYLLGLRSRGGIMPKAVTKTAPKKKPAAKKPAAKKLAATKPLPTPKARASTKLSVMGKTVVLTGSVIGMERADAESKLEAVLRVSGDLESLVLVALAFEEAGNLVLLFFGDVGQHLVGSIEVATKHQSLVFDHTERKGE